jgi:hypothetical protein
MHVFRSWEPDEKESPGTVGTCERRDVRQQSAEAPGVVRCPRCRAVLVAAVRRGEPGFYCRCLARLPIPA